MPTASASRPSRARSGRSAFALAAVLTCQLMVMLDGTIVNIALPDIRRALHFSPAELSWVLNAYTLTFGGLLLLGARAGDLLGRRRVLLAGIAVFTAASLAGGVATTPGMLLAARAVQGAGAAFAAPSALAFLTIMFEEGRERTRALALYTAVTIGGAAVGLVAGGLLVEWASWKWVFFVNVPIGVALVLVGRTSLPETTRANGQVDIPGAVTSTLGMAAVVYGLVHAASSGWGKTETLVAFAVGVALLAAFVAIETRAATPITPLRLFADRNRSSAYLARLLLVGGMFGMFFFLSQFLQGVLGYSPLVTGLAFLPITTALFVASQLSARVLIGRVSAKVQMAGGLTLSACGLLLLTQLSQHTSYGVLLASLLLFGTGNGVAFVPLTTMSLQGVDARDAGAASGLVNTAQQVGGSLGLATLVTVFAAAQRSAAHRLPAHLSEAAAAARTFVAGADRAFWVSAGLVAGAMVLMATTRPEPRVAPEPQAEPELVSAA
ncbi:MAG: MFS transporter [Acidimicrobiaceae bacterium]|nr:MFS transporter [Acidimicrobiaceae bacterium]